MSKQKLPILLLAVLVSSALPVCAQDRVLFAVVASTKTTGYTPLWAALKQGFFAQQGLDVQPIVIRGSERAIQALAGGSVYASVLAPDASMTAADRGLDAIIVAGNTQRPAHWIFASDFPHEIGPDDIMHEIEEVSEAPLAGEDKRAVLRENAKRFYRI